MLWYAGVYGFPDFIDKPTPQLKGATPTKIRDNPNKYGAVIIGQGLHFKKADSKKVAASQAVLYLEGKKIKKLKLN